MISLEFNTLIAMITKLAVWGLGGYIIIRMFLGFVKMMFPMSKKEMEKKDD